MNNFKKIISVLLIFSMIFASNSFSLFANIEMNYENNAKENVTDVATLSELDDVESDNSNYEEEPEVDETITIGVDSNVDLLVSDDGVESRSAILDDEEVNETTTIVLNEIHSSEEVSFANTSNVSLCDEIIDDIIDEVSFASPSNVSLCDETIDEIIDDEIEIATTSNAENIFEIEFATISEINSLHSNSLFGVGETYWFGTFPQNDGDAKQLEPIPWKLLNVEDDGTALFTTYTLVYPSYFNEEIDVNATWRDCDLRDWLNDYFFNKAFSNNQKNGDLLVDKEAVTDGETYNLGKIFILDIDQVNAYLSYYLDRILEPTEWDNTVGIGTSQWWWLRNRAGDIDWGKVVFVDHEGEIRSSDGENMNKPTMGVRPAIYLKTSSSTPDGYKVGNDGKLVS